MFTQYRHVIIHTRTVSFNIFSRLEATSYDASRRPRFSLPTVTRYRRCTAIFLRSICSFPRGTHVNCEYERSGFTFSADTSRGFPSHRQLTRQPQPAVARMHLAFAGGRPKLISFMARPRPSRQLRFLSFFCLPFRSHSSSLSSSLSACLSLCLLSLSRSRRRALIFLRCVCLSLGSSFVSPDPSLLHLTPFPSVSFLFCPILSSCPPLFFSFLEMSRVHSRRELGFICILELHR